MTRSYKKPYYTISKAWDKFKEHGFRRRTKAECHKIEQEIDFNPDKDFEESLQYNKMGSWGTRIGWHVPLLPDDTWFDVYEEARRK